MEHTGTARYTNYLRATSRRLTGDCLTDTARRTRHQHTGTVEVHALRVVPPSVAPVPASDAANSRAPGEKDRHLFNVIGINTRQCERHTHPTRGAGFRSVSREIMVYLDPTTGQIIDTWKNPWTG
ncbi:MAG: DUF1838 domain-containing protein, partial [Actinobacteria bacterium]|nr:DUF1838 domain-containing protein [Actinomycetota bacterium]